MNELPLLWGLLLAALLFAGGVFLVVARRSYILVLMGLELMFNAVNLNLVVFNRAYPEQLSGQVFVLFVVLVAACEAALVLALLNKLYQAWLTEGREKEEEDLL